MKNFPFPFVVPSFLFLFFSHYQYFLLFFLLFTGRKMIKRGTEPCNEMK